MPKYPDTRNRRDMKDIEPLASCWTKCWPMRGEIPLFDMSWVNVDFLLQPREALHTICPFLLSLHICRLKQSFSLLLTEGFIKVS